jgi:hypothetical protein
MASSCHCQRETAFQRFRWTHYTTKVALIGLVLVPGAIFYYCNTTHVRPIVSSVASPADCCSTIYYRCGGIGQRNGKESRSEGDHYDYHPCFNPDEGYKMTRGQHLSFGS